MNRDLLSKMKPSAMLINTSRGPVVAEQDLADALNHGVIAAAAVDVLSTEPSKACLLYTSGSGYQGDRHLSILHRLAQHLHGVPGKFRQLIQKQYPVAVSYTHLYCLPPVPIILRALTRLKSMWKPNMSGRSAAVWARPKPAATTPAR